MSEAGSDKYTAEEIQNAPIVIPLSMGVSTLLNGTLGFAMLLALLSCMPSDIDSVLGSNTYYPFMNIYAYAVGSNSGATAMVSHLTTVLKKPRNANRPFKSPDGYSLIRNMTYSGPHRNTPKILRSIY